LPDAARFRRRSDRYDCSSQSLPGAVDGSSRYYRFHPLANEASKPSSAPEAATDHRKAFLARSLRPSFSTFINVGISRDSRDELRITHPRFVISLKCSYLKVFRMIFRESIMNVSERTTNTSAARIILKDRVNSFCTRYYLFTYSLVRCIRPFLNAGFIMHSAFRFKAEHASLKKPAKEHSYQFYDSIKESNPVVAGQFNQPSNSILDSPVQKWMDSA